MKEQMKRTVYEAPETKLFRIEMESGFCSGSADVENPNKEDVGQIEDHSVNTGLDENNFDVSGWE